MTVNDGEFRAVPLPANVRVPPLTAVTSEYVLAAVSVTVPPLVAVEVFLENVAAPAKMTVIVPLSAV